MPASPTATPVAPLHALFVALLLVVGIFAFTGTWLVVAASYDSHAGWMALLAAAVAVVMLRLTGVPSSPARSVLALLATAAAIALGNWLVAALPIAQEMGLTPLMAARRIGPHFGWTLVSLGNAPLDWLWVGLALASAVRLGR